MMMMMVMTNCMYYLMYMYDLHICRFRATIYQCPETQAERREMLLGIQTRIEDMNTVRIYLLLFQ